MYIGYSYRGKKYRDVPVHQCIVAGLQDGRITVRIFGCNGLKREALLVYLNYIQSTFLGQL